jgi:4-aminobutyrate aminotransferase
VTNTGHCHPRVVQAIQAQVANFLLWADEHRHYAPVLASGPKAERDYPAVNQPVFFANSGAEAVEAAVKLARSATQRRNLVVFQGSFHGRTHQTMAMTTSKYIYRYQLPAAARRVFVAPFPYAYQYGWDEETAVDFCLQQLDLLLHSQTAPEETAAFVIEPVLGEGGYVPAPRRFLQGLRQL